MGDEDRIDAPLRRLMIVMLLGGIMGILDTTVVNVGLDTISRRLHTSVHTIQWLPTGYLLAFAMTIPASTWAIARFGGRQLWLTGLSVFLAGSALCALAWDPGSLIGFRILQGLGAGILEPTLMTVLTQAAGSRRIGRMMGVLGTFVALGPILGPLLGSVIISHADWRWMFAINLPLGLVALALAIRVVPADPPVGGARLDVRGLALLSPGFALVVYALSTAGGPGGFATPTVIGCLAGGAALLAGYVGHARRAVAPPLDVRLFAARGFTLGVTAMFLVGGALFSMLFVLPLYFQQVRGYSVLDAGLLLIPQGVGAWIGMPFAGRLSDRIGPRSLVTVGATLAAAGLVGYAVGGVALPLLTCSSLVAGFGLGCIGAPAMSSIYRSVEPTAVPGATTAIYVLNQIGAAAAVATAALLITHSGNGFRHAFWCAIALLLCIAVLSRWMPTATGQPATEQTEPAAASHDHEAIPSAIRGEAAS